MATRIFRLDLSDDARDFQHVATEPGLAMLDRNGANYAILRRWLGDLVAEPEWNGPDTVSFYIRDEARGRLTEFEAIPATRQDLEGPLKEQLETIRAKLKKARPESSTEQLLHNIARRSFGELTANLETTDFDSFFFKFREGKGPWRLIWCWGYQRADMQPAKALICTNQECEQLFVRREGQRPSCPGCQTLGGRRKKSAGLLLGRVGTGALLLLLLLAALVFFFGQPKLVVSPASWSGPKGAGVSFRVHHKRWFLFDDDVTQAAVPQSSDSRVMEFKQRAGWGVARSQGDAVITFRYGDRVVDVPVRVGPPLPPNSLRLEPGSLELAAGSTGMVTVWGEYEEHAPVDLTASAEYVSGDSQRAYASSGLVEGLAAGETTVTVRYRPTEDDEYVSAELPVRVVETEFKELAMDLDPLTLARGQSGRLQVFGIDAAGQRHSLIGSSRLRLEVAPAGAGVVEGEYLTARAPGGAEVRGVLRQSTGDLSISYPFMVAEQGLLAEDTLAVVPARADLLVGERFRFDIVSASLDMPEVTSSDESVAGPLLDGESVVGRSVGGAELTFRQGNRSTEVPVTVSEAVFASVHLEPSMLTLRPGEEAALRIVAVTEGGREIEVAPEFITWLSQPLTQYLDLNRGASRLRGIAPTPRPQDLVFEFMGHTGGGVVEVVGGPGATELVDSFLTYPPVGGRGIGASGPVSIGVGDYLGPGLVYNDGLVLGDVPADSMLGTLGLPRGTVITGVNDDVLLGRDLAGIRRYFGDRPVAVGDMLRYRLPDGTLGSIRLGDVLGAVQEVRLLDVQSRNLTGADFSADLRLQLRAQAEYRLSDREGNPLTDWALHGPQATVILRAEGLARTADDEYELYVERRSGDTVRRFQVPFKLEPE